MSFVDTALTAATDIIGDIATPYALIYRPMRAIGTIVPDVTVREVHIDEDTITVHPVETGTPVSDHVFANPKLVEITAGFSDSSAGYSGYVQEIYEEFLALKAEREPFDVFTGKRAYKNMLFASIQVVTDTESEYALMTTLRLQEVIITSTDGSSGAGAISDQANPEQTAGTADAGKKSLGAGIIGG